MVNLGLSSNGVLFVSFKILILAFFLSTFVQPLCHVHERSYLLQFKESFVMNMSASSDPWAYPKVSSWTLQEGNNSNCCSWDGVECDEFTGHVIGLDLSSSWLFGSIDSTSSLFHLISTDLILLTIISTSLKFHPQFPI